MNRLLVVTASLLLLSALPGTAQAQGVKVTVEDVTQTGATLRISGHTDWWHYKQVTPSTGSCTAVKDGQTASLSDLSDDVAYTYHVFDGTNCAAENKIGDVSFRAVGFGIKEKGRTTATLELKNFPLTTVPPAQHWWYRQTYPSLGACTHVGTADTVAVSGLTKNTSYTYQAYRYNNSCQSNGWIATTHFKTLPTHALEYSDLTQTTVKLTLENANVAWKYQKTDGPGAPGSCTDVPKGTTSVDVSGLTANTEYTYTAYRASCTDEQKIDWESFTTLPPVPDAPTQVSATALIEGAALSWTAGNDNGGAITGWKIQQKTGSTWGSWTAISGSGASTTSHTVTGLTGGSDYAFKVRAVNAGGDGDESSEASVTALVKPAVNLSVSPTSVAEDASATTVTVTAALSNSNTFTTDQTVTVTVGASGTATSGTDYAAVSNFDITITKGKGSGTGTFTLTPTDDTSIEGDETIGIAGSATGLTVNSVNLTLTDDDEATVTVNDASASEGDEITFTVTLDKAVPEGLKVTPSYTNGTAEDGDYTENTTEISFTGTANETKTFTVSTTEDAVLEANETFTVGLTVSGTTHSVTASDTGTGTINNDDSATVTVNDAEADEGDDITFTVTLSAAVQGGLTVTPGYTNVTAADGDYTENTTALTFDGTADETKTFTVSTTEDEVAESDETFTVGLTVSDAPSGVTSTDTGTGTIEDDDGSSINVTVNDASASEGDGITFTVTLDQAVQGGLKVTPSYTNGTAASTDYTANTTELSFSGTANETKTFTVATKEDAVLEADETFTVNLAVSGTSLTVDATDTGTGTINNDDSATVTVNDASASEGGSMTFTVTLSAAVQGGLKVTPDYTDVTTASGDYTANTTALTFSGTANETKTFSVSTTEDATLEANETFTVGLTVAQAPSGVTSSDTGTGTINNDDSAAVTVNNASASEGDGITFTVTLDKAVQGGLEVTPSYTNGTAASTDYTANTTAVSFTGTAGETKTFTVSTTEDAVVEANETFTVALSVSDAPSGVTSTDTGTGTINDDDSAAVTVNDASADEGDAITFTVTLSAAVQGGLKVTPSYTNGTAGSGDYTANTSELTFTGTADETKTFTVATKEDQVAESDETFTVSLSVSGTSLTVTSTDTGTGTIEDDDGSGINVTVNNASASEGASMTFTVTLSAAVQGGLTVTPSYTSGTAASTDYTANTTALTFTGNKNETKMFTVATKEDQILEANETFTVGLTVSNTSISVDDSDTGTGTINNDDTAAVTVNNASALEGNSMTFTVTLNKAVQGGLKVTPSQTDVTTTASNDYTANTTALTFSGTVGETKTFTVSTTEDAIVEANETFTVGLTVSDAPSGVTSTDTGTGTINNDDSAAVTVDDAEANEGDAITFTVTLSAAVQGGLTVTPSYVNKTAASTDYTKSTTGLTFTGTANETQTFTVATTDDAVAERDETFTVRLAVSGTSLTVTSTDTGMGTINDNDSSGISVTVNDASASEGASMTFTVTLSTAVQGGLTVTPSYTNGTAASTDYTANTSGVTFTGNANEQKTFTVSTREDAIIEADETFTVGLSVSGTSITIDASDTGTGTITNDDTTPSVDLSVSPASVAEGAARTVTVTAAFSPANTFTADKTVTVSVGGTGTATSGVDYASVSDFDITISAGQNRGTGTFVLTPTADGTTEGTETIGISGSASGLTVGATSLGLTDASSVTQLTLGVDGAQARVAEGSDGITVSVSASFPNNRTLAVDRTVAVSVDGGTATAGVDFEAVPGFNITIPAGQSGATGTFELVPIQDNANEGDETILVTGSAAGLTVTSATITLVDDDQSVGVELPEVNLTATPARVAEGSEATVTVTAAFSTDQTFGSNTVVTVSVGGGTATAGADYGAVPDFDIVIPAADTSGVATFTLSAADDNVVEGDETITVSGKTADLTVNETLITLTDKTAAGLTLRLDPASVSEGASATVVTVTATLSGGTVSSADQRVSVRVGGGTATAGTDYAAVRGFAITIPAGQASATGTFTLSPTQDAWVEGEEKITVAGGTADMRALDVPLALADDDPVPGVALSADPPSVGEGASETPVTVTATFTNASRFAEDRAVTVSVNGGTATSGTDFATVADVEVTIPAGAGSGSATFTLAPMSDALVEGDETIGLHGAAAELAVTGTAVTVADDDEVPAVALSVDPARVDEGAAATPVTVTAAFTNGSMFAEDRVVTVSVNGGTATPGSDFTTVADVEVTIPAGANSGSATFTLAPMPDALVEGDETIELSGAADELAVTGTAVTVADDDERPAVELSVDPARVDEGAAATPVTVTAAFTNASTFAEDRVVTVTVNGGAATPGEDYATVPPFAITIPAGGSSGTGAFTLAPMDDDVTEEDETIELSGMADELAVTGTTVTVADDDDGRGRERALGVGLATFGRTIATQAVDVIGARFEAASRHVRAAELASLFGPDPVQTAGMLAAGAAGYGSAGYGGTGRDGAGYGAPGLGDASAGVGLGGLALGGNAFGGALGGMRAASGVGGAGFGLGGSRGLATGRPLALSLGGGNGGARGWSLWASGARTDFAGRPAGFSADGTMSAAFVGVDHTLGAAGLFGVAVSRSQGDAGLDGASHWTGDVGTRMTTVYPYLRLAPGRGFDVWGMVGVGRGDVDIADGAGVFEADGSLEMAAAGLRGALARLGGFDLAVRADAFAVGMTTDEIAGGPGAAEGRAQRLRLLLDGRAHLRLSASSRLTPSFEVGARADGGDAEAGLGMEVGGGLAYANTRLGLDIAARGRWLARHEEEDFEEWGGNVSIRRVPTNPNRGLSLLVEPAWGEDASGVAALWEGRSLRRGDFGFGLGPERAADAWRPDRLDMEMAYGTGLLGRDHSLKPFGRLRLMGEGSRHTRVGTRLEFANAASSGLRLELLGEQRVRAGDASNYGAGLNVGVDGLRTAAGLLAPFGEVVLDGRSGQRVAFGTRWRLDGADLGGAVPGGLRLELAGEAYREANEPVEFGLVLRGGVGLGMW